MVLSLDLSSNSHVIANEILGTSWSSVGILEQVEQPRTDVEYSTLYPLLKGCREPRCASQCQVAESLPSANWSLRVTASEPFAATFSHAAHGICCLVSSRFLIVPVSSVRQATRFELVVQTQTRNVG